MSAVTGPTKTSPSSPFEKPLADVRTQVNQVAKLALVFFTLCSISEAQSFNSTTASSSSLSLKECEEWKDSLLSDADEINKEAEAISSREKELDSFVYDDISQVAAFTNCLKDNTCELSETGVTNQANKVKKLDRYFKLKNEFEAKKQEWMDEQKLWKKQCWGLKFHPKSKPKQKKTKNR